MEALTRLSVRRPVAVSVVAAALVVLGWTAWDELPLDLLPDIQSPTVVVSIRSGDRPPSEMERIYGEQVEQRLFAVRGIREIEQVARTGRLIATVIFDWDSDMDFALIDVEKAVGPMRSDSDVDELVVRHFDPRQSPVMSVGLVADERGPGLVELRRIARRQVAIGLERLAGVAEVRVTGGREEEVQVLVNRYRALEHGVTLSSIESRLRAVNVDINAGTLEEGNAVYLVRGMARFREPADVADVVLRYGQDAQGNRAPVRVSDVADVRLAPGEVRHLVRVNGEEGVGLAIYKEAGANTVDVSRQVRAALETMEGDLPGIEVALISDEAALVEEAIADVETAALFGVGLAVLVLILFLRSFGPIVVVSIAVPVSLLGTLFSMHFGGHSLNVMTLGGLALGAGMLVDNAIVVVESIFRRLGGGMDVDEAAARGTADVTGAIAASTLTTCAVFLPIVFVRGLAARLVTGISFTVVVSLSISLLVAVFLIPALARWLLPKTGARVVDPGRGRVERLVDWLLGAPSLVILLAALAAVGAGFSLSQLGTELLPPSDPRQFSVRILGPPGQRVEATSRVADSVEQILRQAAGDDLRAILAEVGRLPEDDRLIRQEQTEENTARITVRLASGGVAAGRVVEAAERAVSELGRVEAIWDVGASALARSLGTGGPPIVVEILGTSIEDLRAGAEQVRAALADADALWNVRSSFEGGPPELRVMLRRSTADALGADLNTIASTIEAALDGRAVTVLSAGDEERDVVLRLPPVRRTELAALPLVTTSGVHVTVGEVARIEPLEGAREIFRKDQRRVARVTARIAPDADFPTARQAVTDALADVDLLPGLRAKLTGDEAERESTFAELRFAGLLALLLVFMVLAGTFESLIHPFTVVCSVPLALVGVAAILVPLGHPIGVMELLGAIVLAGVAVNDAILLVDAARRFMKEGMPRRKALARAAGTRLRPITMTTATTVLAMLPLALGGGDASRLRSPLALTIIGGIVTATIGTLFVIPAIYSVFDRLHRRGDAS